MGFEPFERGAQSHPDDPVASIRQNGNLYLNPAAYKLLRRPSRVELFYDRDAQRIGIRIARPTSVAYRRPTQLRQAGSAEVSIRGLILEYGLQHAMNRRYRVFLDGNALIVDLLSESAPMRKYIKKSHDAGDESIDRKHLRVLTLPKAS